MPRSRTPTSILKARGSFKKHPERRRPDEPQVTEELGEPPAMLKSNELQAWRDIVEHCAAGVLRKSDRIAVEIAASLLAQYRRAPGKFPSAKLGRLEILLGKFGMNPSDRSKVSAPRQPENNPFTGLLKIVK